ncbi:MAG TPA: NAD-dependent epimerase/dehydratase family protein [Bacteroidota bacterium]|nr:NAD-dependent epimerase/dehydratase family protein [Bacteroidota bacterium]
MTILVTGGAGFIGSHVVDAYVNEGHRVVIIDDFSSGAEENVNPRAILYRMDIRSEEVATVFERERIDIVSHHAAQMDVRRSVADPKFDASVNILGGLNIFENARRFGVKRIIFASTGGAIYGEQDYFPADEEHPLRPLSPYGITKLSTEKYLFYYKEVHGIPYTILRYANIYGPRQNPHGEAGVVAIFCNKMLKGEQPIINGDGKQTRDYTFVEDVVRANVLALKSKDSAIYNIGTGIETDVNTLFRILAGYLKPGCAETHGPAKQGEQMRSVISSARIQRELGWLPKISLEDGLRLTADYFRKTVSVPA